MARLIFIDSANLDEIKKWQARGICKGVTTNQKILLKEKNIDFKKSVVQICKITKKSVAVELIEHESASSMIKEAKKYAGWAKNIVVKVPMTLDGMGLEVINSLQKLHIKTNATLMVSFEQMLLAISAGASYASIFFNRAKDSGYNPKEIIERTRNFIDNGKYPCQIIAGSIRQKRDVGDAFSFGSDIVTVPPKILEEMLNEKMTQKTLEEFDLDWKKFLGK